MDFSTSRRRPEAIAAAAAISLVGLFSTSSFGKTTEKAESIVEIDASASDGRTINRTFDAIVEGGEKLLLRKEVERRFNSEFGPSRGRVRVDAWRLPRTRGDKPLYTIIDQADEIGWFMFPLLLTTRVEACCDSRGSLAVFSARTGRILVYANGSDDSHLATITREQAVTLIGVLDEHGGRDVGALPDHREGHFSLLVSEADLSGCRRQLVFDLPAVPTVYATVSSMAWKKVEARHVIGLQVDLAHGHAMSGTLELGISDKRQIAIPVGESGLDSSRVVLPPDGKMKVISPCVP